MSFPLVVTQSSRRGDIVWRKWHQRVPRNAVSCMMLLPDRPEPQYMRRMQRQSLIAYGQPLCETVADCPSPRGAEVLVRIERCGVCHSDLHLQDGYFSLGADKKLDVSAGRTLPFTLGHEIAGVIERIGSDADPAIVGHRVAVYPWIGCGTCAACRGGEENLCGNNRYLGVAVDGGFATHVLVPHQRYLLDYAPLPANFAGPLMCSGLTAYAALKRHTSRPERSPVGAAVAAGSRRIVPGRPRRTICRGTSKSLRLPHARCPEQLPQRGGVPAGGFENTTATD